MKMRTYTGTWTSQNNADIFRNTGEKGEQALCIVPTGRGCLNMKMVLTEVME